MHLYIAITNHGFGHATRTAALMAIVRQRCPSLQLTFATQIPSWLLRSYLQTDAFTYRPVALDVGVVQRDSLTMDKPATLERWQQLQQQQAAIVAQEAQFIRETQVSLVIGDVPPLAAAVARAADRPCWMISNFGWDFIYRPWGGAFEALADWIATHYHTCDRLYRLPFHDTMSAFPVIQDVGLTGGTPCYSAEMLRSKLSIHQPRDRTVLLTFGGMGVAQIPYDRLSDFPDWQFISLDEHAPSLPNLITVTNPPYRPVDLMQLCGFVISKPGYSTFSEACRLGVPVISITREDFAEGPVLTAGLQAHHPHRILSPDELVHGSWDFLRQPLQPPRCATPFPTNGNDTIADAIIRYLAA